MSGSLSRNRAGLRSAKWVVLLGLVLAQVALAAHQFEHELLEHDQSCSICVQFDRDDVLIDDASIHFPPVFSQSSHSDATYPARILTCSPFNARASPQSQ